MIQDDIRWSGFRDNSQDTLVSIKTKVSSCNCPFIHACEVWNQKAGWPFLFRFEEEFLNFERLPVPPNEALPNDVIKQTVAA